MSKTSLNSSASCPALRPEASRSASKHALPLPSRKASLASPGANSRPESLSGDRSTAAPSPSTASPSTSSPSRASGGSASRDGSRPGTSEQSQRPVRPCSEGASPGQGARARSTSSCRLRLGFGSPGAAQDPRAAPAAYVSGLAAPTRQENRKADKLEEQFQRAKGFAKAPGPRAEERRSSKAGAPAGEAGASGGADFEEDLKHFEGLLAELGKSLRMDKLLEAASQAEQREEEQKRQRERERRLREAARDRKAAAHPRRRIALRLERSREVGIAEQVELTSTMNIPVKKHMILSGHTPERLEIVNVPMLQKRCIGVSGDGSSTSYKLVRDLAEIEERRQLWDTATLGAQAPHNYVKENMVGDSIRSRTRDCVSSKMSQQERRLQERHREARLRRRAAAEERFQRREDDMLSRSLTRTETDLLVSSLQEVSPSNAMQPKDAKQKGPKSLWNCPPLEALKRRLSLRDKEEAPAKSIGRGLFLWGVLRSVLGAVWLLQLVRVRHRAFAVVRNFLGAVHKFKRVRLGAQRVNASVLTLQAGFRAFLQRKRRWCEGAAKQWTQFEDQYLMSCFKVAGQRPEDPAPAEHPRNGRRRRRSEWQVLRVPPAHRRFTLGRWYVAQVRHWVERREYWASIVNRAVQQQTDVRNYMRLCGIEPPTSATGPRRGSGRAGLPEELSELPLEACLSLGEPEALDLLRLAVSELAAAAPFQDHPAMRGDSAKPGCRVSGRLLRILKKRQAAAFSRRSSLQADHPRRGFSMDTIELVDYGEPEGDSQGERRPSDVDEKYPLQLQLVP